MQRTELDRLRLQQLLVSVLLPGLLFLGACGDEDDGPQIVEPYLTVSVTPGFDPVPGVKVMVMDGASNAVVAGPVVSDAEGKCTFPGLDGGPYQVVPFAGSRHEVVSIEPSSWDLRFWSGNSQGGLSWAPDQTAPAPSGPTIWLAELVTPGALPRIAGTVTDAMTGDPLEAAFVSLFTAMGGYTWNTRFYDDVTLADGSFAVTEIPFAQDPESGHLVQIMPLLVHRQGYRPRAWYHSAANGDDNLDISGVIIPLEPIDPDATGGIQGRVFLLGEPAAGVVVGISLSAGGKSAVGQPGLSALTDQEGRFLLTHVPEGYFYLESGYLVGDGVVSYFPAGHHPHPVTAGQITGAGDQFLLHEITLYSPAAGGRYLNASVIFPMEWSPIPGAARYRVMVDRGTIGESTTNRLEQPDGFQLSAGVHVWSVAAFDDEDRQIGMVERVSRFTLGSGAE